MADSTNISVHNEPASRPRIKATYITDTKHLPPYLSLAIGDVTFYLHPGEQAEYVGRELAIAAALLLSAPKESVDLAAEPTDKPA